jgi:hypothetical protein
VKIRPLLSSAAAELTHDVEVMDERCRLKTISISISIPAERPLTMYVDKRELVTLMTEPWAYLKDVLTRLPGHLDSRIDELLPHRWQPSV